MTANAWTEATVADLLERQHAPQGGGNGPQFAFMRQVRNDGSFDATRTFDAVAVNLWKSQGYEVHVFEIKVDRSDFLAEIKDPAKAEDAFRVADRFSLVAPKGIASKDEIPDTWGYREISEAGRLRTVKAAPPLHRGKRFDVPFQRGFVVSMLRRAGRALPTATTPDEAEVERRVASRLAEAAANYQNSIARERASVARLERTMWQWHRASGISLVSLRPDDLERQGREVRAALLDSTATERARQHAKRLVDDLRRAADGLENMITKESDE